MKKLIALLVSILLIASLAVPTFAEEEKHVLHWFLQVEIKNMDSGKTYDLLSAESVAYFADTL